MEIRKYLLVACLSSLVACGNEFLTEGTGINDDDAFPEEGLPDPANPDGIEISNPKKPEPDTRPGNIEEEEEEDAERTHVFCVDPSIFRVAAPWVLPQQNSFAQSQRQEAPLYPNQVDPYPCAPFARTSQQDLEMENVPSDYGAETTEKSQRPEENPHDALNEVRSKY